MAENTIQQDRYDKLLRRVAGMIGPGAKVGNVLSELFPVFDVENMPGELLYLSGTKIAFGSSANTAGGAGILNLHQLFNPVDSGFIITLTDVFMSQVTSTGIAEWEAAIVTVPLANQFATSITRDVRGGGAETPVGQIRNVQQMGSVTAIFDTVVSSANQPFHMHVENDIAILFPGFGMTFVTENANLGTKVAFYWRERIFEASEQVV